MPKTLWWVIGLFLLLIAGIFIGRSVTSHPSSSTTTGSLSSATITPTTIADPSVLPGLQTGSAPWPVELSHLKERLAADKLPALPEEGTTLHIHQHLDIFIDGKRVAVPADIGVSDAEHFISPVHTHDTTSIIHVESPYAATFTLGEAFDIWGVKLTNACIGGYCADATKSLKVYANGTLYQGDPRMLPLTPHEEIAIVYGTAAEAPASIPSSFTFPAGY